MLDAPIASALPDAPELKTETVYTAPQPLVLRPDTPERALDLILFSEQPAETLATEREPEPASPLPAPEAEPVFTDLAPILAARFSRISLVAC